MSKAKTSTRNKPRRQDGTLIHRMMVETGLSREGILKNIRNGTRPVNFLVAQAWDKVMAAHGAAHQTKATP
jgi:hypothetical protein